MPKIVQRVINHKYFSMMSETLLEGTVIPFDCYIKRFDDFVIIISSGTLIDKVLYAKLRQNEILYILKYDSVKVKEYISAYHISDAKIIYSVSREESIEAASRLKERLFSSTDFEEQLSIIYTATADLMEVIFENGDEILPLEALRTCIVELVECLSTGINAMPFVLKVIPEEYTVHHHSTNVAYFTAIVSKALHIPKEDRVDFTFAGLLHDIGKMRIDKSLLLKPGSLEPDEYEIMQCHSDDGYTILENNGITNQKILNGIRYHHEKLDGTGYPKQLRGKMIPKSARIIGMCDIFDALTTKRTFRPNYTSFEALQLIKQDMNAQFDEHITDAFIRLLK